MRPINNYQSSIDNMIKSNRMCYTKRETRLLLDIWRHSVKTHSNSENVPNSVKYGYFAMVLSTHGYTRTWKQIEGKLKKLRKLFFTVIL